MAPEWHLPANMYSGWYFRKCFHTLILKADWRLGGGMREGIPEKGELQNWFWNFLKVKKVPHIRVQGGLCCPNQFWHFLWTSGDLGNGLVWDHPPPPPRFLVRLLKSSSNWTKSPMMGPQLFWGWYQMILDLFRCSQLFSDVLDCFPTMFSDCWNPLQAELNYLWWVLSCSQDDIRWF